LAAERMAERTTDNPGKRALVVADEAVVGEGLCGALIDQLEQGVGSVFVVAPVLAGSAFKHYAADIDAAVPAARDRLRETLEQLRKAGLEAEGEVGDADPIQAISDEVLRFQPDQVLIVGHRDEDGAFAERGLLAHAQRDLDLPVTELFVEAGASHRVLDVERTDPGAEGNGGWRPSGNLPPLSKGNVAGVVVAVVGTLLLGALAAACFAGSDHDDWVCAARTLIALGFALLNLAHVVGLLLFQSVRYEGIWSHAFARLSLYGTPIAVAVSLSLGLF
jgi:hypothetical protein